MKLLIAGGTGLIGSALAARATRLKHDVVVLSRSKTLPRHGRGVLWDGRSEGDWASELDDADAVVVLRRIDFYRSIRGGGAAGIVEQIHKHLQQ